MARAEIDLWVAQTFQIDLEVYPAPAQQHGNGKHGHEKHGHGHKQHGHKQEEHAEARTDVQASFTAEGDLLIEIGGPAPEEPTPPHSGHHHGKPKHVKHAAEDDAATEVRSLNIPGIPIPIPTPDPIKHCIVNGKLNNKTSQVLKLGKATTTSGDVTEDPPGEILAKSEEEFRAESAFPHMFKGAVGAMDYAIGEDGTKWVLSWSIPRIGDNKATSTITGPSKDKYHTSAHSGANAEADFKYTLQEKGGGGDTPTPANATNSNCQITVTNNTKLPLALADQGHDRGDFMTQPPMSLAPGGSASFVSVETPGAKEQGCKGFVSWEVGSPATGTWRVEWDNPEKEKNTVKGSVIPESGGFKSVEQIGQGDENVPVTFVLSGGGGGTGPDQPEQPDPPFEPPAKPGQPTLRKGDKSPDGWVEYAQQLLNFQMKSALAIDGNFGNGTFAAVKKFQAAKKLSIVDGIIGNETWAALREGAPEKAGTDGRKPHSFEEKGKQARFTTEAPHMCHYLPDKDLLDMRIVSTGEQDIEGTKVTVRVTQPNGTQKTQSGPIGPVNGPTPDGQGQLHSLTFEGFSKRFKIADPATVKACVVEAYIDKEAGGDTFKGHPELA